MGGQSSLLRGYGKKKEVADYDDGNDDHRGHSRGHKRSNVAQLQLEFDDEFDIPMEVIVAHFTPANFPLQPVVNRKTAAVCSKSWDLIARDYTNEYGLTTSGMTMFYNEFYDRLDTVDSAGKFDAVYSKNVGSQNKIAAKGALLIRIVQFMLTIDGDTKQTQINLYMLGRSHSQKGIRPWQYATFVQTLLLTIANRLGNDATGEVMENWVHLFAFVFKSMIPQAIKGQVIPTEINVNSSSAFNDGKIADELQKIQEEKDVKRMLKGSQWDGSSDHGSSVAGKGQALLASAAARVYAKGQGSASRSVNDIAEPAPTGSVRLHA